MSSSQETPEHDALVEAPQPFEAQANEDERVHEDEQEHVHETQPLGSLPASPLASPLVPPLVPPLAHGPATIEAPPGGPYRVAEQPEVAVAPYVHTAPRPWPIFGPSLSVFAVLLWSFVVAGQFTTSWSMGKPLGQGVAIGMVFIATFVAWLINVRASAIAEPSRSSGRIIGRAIGIGALAFVYFVLAIIVATAFGQSARGLDLFVAFALVAVSLVAAIVGPRLTMRVRPTRTHRERVTLVVTWIVGVLLTLVAGADLAANG